MKINTLTTSPTQNFGARRLPDFALRKDALSGFMSEIRKFPLLTREGEIALGREIQAGVTKIPIAPKWSTVTNKELLRLTNEQKQLAVTIKKLTLPDKEKHSKELENLSVERRRLTNEHRKLTHKRNELPEEAQELDGISQEQQKITKRLEQLSQRQQKLSDEIQSLSPPKQQDMPKEQINNQKSSQAEDSVPEANAAIDSELEEDAVSEANAENDAESGQEFIYVLNPAAKQAANKLVNANLRLVVAFAKKFLKMYLPLGDFVQEGSIGLMKAAERFDPERGYRFSTYAYHWIRQSVTRFIQEHRKIIRVPLHMSESIRKVEVAERKLAGKFGRKPSEEELAAEVGLSVEKLQEVKSFDTAEPLSLDMAVYEDGKHDLADTISDENSVNTIDAITSYRLNNDVKNVLDNLPKNQADILKKRFGLAGEVQQSLQEIGDSTMVSKKGRGKGVRNGNGSEHNTYSRERIRQLEVAALRKIRNSPAGAKLRDYLDSE